jgi:hypothetical protein
MMMMMLYGMHCRSTTVVGLSQAMNAIAQARRLTQTTEVENLQAESSGCSRCMAVIRASLKTQR